jgi:hypothetical protein
MTDNRFAKTIVRSQMLAAIIAICLFAPRIALSDCCNCTFDLGDDQGVVPFCEGNDLTSCPITSTGFNCATPIPGGMCDPSNNTIGSTCVGPAPTNTPSQTPTETPTGTPTSTPTITPTPTPVPNGGACMTSSQCVSGICVDNICQAQNGAPAVSNHNMVFLALALLLGGLWTVGRRLPRRH